MLLMLRRAVAMEEDDLRRVVDEVEGTAKYRFAPGDWVTSIESCRLVWLSPLAFFLCKFVLGAKVYDSSSMPPTARLARNLDEWAGEKRRALGE